jgi:hypothetical protein
MPMHFVAPGLKYYIQSVFSTYPLKLLNYATNSQKLLNLPQRRFSLFISHPNCTLTVKKFYKSVVTVKNCNASFCTGL